MRTRCLGALLFALALVVVDPDVRPIGTVYANGWCQCESGLAAYDNFNNYLGDLFNTHGSSQVSRGGCAFFCFDWANAWRAEACSVHQNVDYFIQSASYRWDGEDYRFINNEFKNCP